MYVLYAKQLMKENVTCSELDSIKIDNGNSSLGFLFRVTHLCVTIYDTAHSIFFLFFAVLKNMNIVTM